MKRLSAVSPSRSSLGGPATLAAARALMTPAVTLASRSSATIVHGSRRSINCSPDLQVRPAESFAVLNTNYDSRKENSDVLRVFHNPYFGWHFPFQLIRGSRNR